VDVHEPVEKGSEGEQGNLVMLLHASTHACFIFAVWQYV